MRKTKIKICGIKSERECEWLNEVGVDYAGFVFFENSKRFVNIERAIALKKRLSSDILPVAVTVSPDEMLLSRLHDAGFEILQVHGDHDKDAIQYWTGQLWRAVNVSDFSNIKEEIQRITKNATREGECNGLSCLIHEETPYDKIAGIVYDAASFGSGQPSDWRSFHDVSLKELSDGKMAILAGGLRPDNVAQAMRIFHPHIVDVSSGVEGSNGKDYEKILQFVREVERADEQ